METSVQIQDVIEEICTPPLSPLVGVEVLQDLSYRRISEAELQRLVDMVAGDAAERGVVGNSNRSKILGLAEEPLRNVQNYQKIRFEVKDLAVRFQAFQLKENTYCVNLSNNLYPEDALSLSEYIRSVLALTQAEAHAQMRGTLPRTVNNSVQGAGIGLLWLRTQCCSFEYSMLPAGDFIAYTIRVSVEIKNK